MSFDTMKTAVDSAVITTFKGDTAATYNGSTSVDGIFDNEYLEVFGGGEVGVQSSTPVYVCKASDVPSAAHGDTLLINATTYTVRGVEPDGGLTRLILEAP